MGILRYAQVEFYAGGEWLPLSRWDFRKNSHIGVAFHESTQRFLRAQPGAPRWPEDASLDDEECFEEGHGWFPGEHFAMPDTWPEPTWDITESFVVSVRVLTHPWRVLWWTA